MVDAAVLAASITAADTPAAPARVGKGKGAKPMKPPSAAAAVGTFRAETTLAAPKLDTAEKARVCVCWCSFLSDNALRPSSHLAHTTSTWMLIVIARTMCVVCK